MELEIIQSKILKINGYRVILDFHLAELYGVELKVFNQAVKRNKERFPTDFLVHINQPDYNSLRSQFVTLENNKRGKHSKFPGLAFTEQGVAMLSSVLRSPKAIEVNIAIMRAFVLLRQHLADYKDFKTEIEKLEREMNRKFRGINEVMKYLLSPKSKPRPIGFKIKDNQNSYAIQTFWKNQLASQ